ncbi:hypothetical protein PPL_12103 [Heterostelium album PN500]|uniref:Uncharacterized protein n=1 Tax=Heterostelium pallidum (strain ATCC 26659 / Pp 5 / PN500) TaxID=670386 RepID=D3BLQ0_HETP5|nr:hypothetical protein PPL_12103 [Heterostelium album PN500]EFA77501.1 hypothetical protein PPL_12103 [Heterostelium album PN500]|eukprot:XP_020429629.1 hypothetical protein PPL_12103 [Heterostelium album PN500]
METNQVKGIEYSDNVFTVCYDGGDYIYLVRKFKYMIICRFNVLTLEFQEIYKSKPNDRNIKLFQSFFYKGLIYCLPVEGDTLQIFNPSDKKVTESQCDKSIVNSDMCFDGNGNIYCIPGHNTFIRFNLETKEKVNLKASNIKYCFSMIHHKVSNEESYIYVVGGVTIGNHRYSIEKDEWEPIFTNDEYLREEFGSAIISTTF